MWRPGKWEVVFFVDRIDCPSARDCGSDVVFFKWIGRICVGGSRFSQQRKCVPHNASRPVWWWYAVVEEEEGNRSGKGEILL